MPVMLLLQFCISLVWQVFVLVCLQFNRRPAGGAFDCRRGRSELGFCRQVKTSVQDVCLKSLHRETAVVITSLTAYKYVKWELEFVIVRTKWRWDLEKNQRFRNKGEVLHFSKIIEHTCRMWDMGLSKGPQEESVWVVFELKLNTSQHKSKCYIELQDCNLQDRKMEEQRSHLNLYSSVTAQILIFPLPLLGNSGDLNVFAGGAAFDFELFAELRYSLFQVCFILAMWELLALFLCNENVIQLVHV